MAARRGILFFVCGLFLISAAIATYAQSPRRDLRLLEAVKRRDQKGFTAALKARADVNATQPDGATALAWAIHLGQRSMADALLSAGARVNTSDEYGETPLTLAASNGDVVLVQRLLAAGANPRAARWNGETAVMIAAGTGSLDVVKQLVARGADVNVADPLRSQTALMWAAAEKHSDVVSGLVEMGANVNAVSKNGFTPLVFAITKNDVESIRTLLKAGANPNITLVSGNKPLIIAMSYKATEAALALVDGGADISVRDRAGNTLLHLASQAGDLAVTKTLLAKGSDANARTPKSTLPAGARGGGGFGRGGGGGEQTALMMAARGDHEDVMRALVAAGADPQLKSQDGTSVLMSASAGGRINTVKYAYEIDPNVDVKTLNGNTPLHVTVQANGRAEPEVHEVVQFLADKGAKLDEMNAGGRTPLSIADGPPLDVVVKLLNKLITASGAVPKIKSKY